MSENPLGIVFVCEDQIEQPCPAAVCAGADAYIPLSKVPPEVIERLRAEHLKAAGGVEIDPDAAEETAKSARPAPVELPPEAVEELPPEEPDPLGHLPPEIRQQEGWGDV